MVKQKGFGRGKNNPIPPKKRLARWLLLLFSLLLFACSQPAPTPTISTAEPTVSSETVVSPTAPTVQQLPVTFTPVPTDFAPTPTTAATLPTFTPSPTPQFFDETVVELRYAIPALELDRRLQGDIGGEIIIVDETSGLALRRTNQGHILIELQQILVGLQLEPLPADCAACVQVSFSLPLANRQQEGWLRDSTLLASIENYMSISLGPHFPPNTVLGLRRSASSIFPAHSLALTEDGRLFRWLATSGQVDPPADAASIAPDLTTELSAVPTASLAADYIADCATKPIETLHLAASEEPQEIRIICPEFVLPTTLQPLYLSLDSLLAPLLETTGFSAPPLAFPLTALLDYRAANGEQLTLYPNNRAVAVRPPSDIVTGTLTSTDVISLTTALVASGELQPDLVGYAISPSANISDTVSLNRLIVRGEDAVYTTSWEETAVDLLNNLDLLLDSLLPPDPTPSPSASATPEPSPTP